MNSRPIGLRRVAPVLAIAAAGLLAACGGGSAAPPPFSTGTAAAGEAPTPAPLPVASYMQSVTVIDGAQTPHGADAISGNLPTNGTGPAIVLTNGSSVVQGVAGGAVLLEFETQTPVSALLVGVSGVEGYYSADLATSTATQSVGRSGDIWNYEPKTNVSVLVRRRDARPASQTTPAYLMSIVLPPNVQLSPSFQVNLVGQYFFNQFSPPSISTFSLVAAGNSSNSFQATLSWLAPVDLDLHVTPPGGSEIGYNNRNNSGGSLDVDSNPDCHIDRINKENVSWATGTAPAGVYRVRPDYFRSCDVTAAISYSLSIRTADTSASPGGPAVYIGKFTTEDRNLTASIDSFAVVYGAVFPPVATDAGLVGRLTLAEIGSPGLAQYNLDDAKTGAKAIRAIVENRKYSPGTFSALSASTRDIIFAKNVQFAGFKPDGTIDGSILRRISSSLFPPGSVQPNTARTEWAPFWNAILTASTQPYSERADDPFVASRSSLVAPYIVDANGNQLPSVPVTGGTFGVRTGGRPYSKTSTDVLNFRLVGTADGQDFYSLNSAFRPTPPAP